MRFKSKKYGEFTDFINEYLPKRFPSADIKFIKSQVKSIMATGYKNAMKAYSKWAQDEKNKYGNHTRQALEAFINFWYHKPDRLDKFTRIKEITRNELVEIIKEEIQKFKKGEKHSDPKVSNLIKKFNSSGRVAFAYPKKKTISVNGRTMPEKKAIEYMKSVVEQKKEINKIFEFSYKAHGKKQKTWTFPSSSSSKKYETVKWEDGTYSCNCPGWTRRVKNNERNCKHIKQVGGRPYKVR